MRSPLRTLLSAALAGPALLLAGSVANAAGEPHKDAEICGGIAGFQCAEGLFCEMTPKANCVAADMSGICRPRPQVCTRIYKPVCGCDGKTYGNDCERQSAGVGKLKDGACG